MSYTRTPVVLSVLVLAGIAAGGCTLFEERELTERVAFSRVRPPVAFEMLRDAPGTPVLDLRTAEEFTDEQGHVKGARNLPLDELPERLDQLVPLKDRTFLVYCGSDACGEQALTALLEAGYEEAILMDGGIEAWLEDGFGTVTGPPPPMEFPPARTERAEVD
ncbi:MAG: rhodanese-like domain-containing protein [Thermoanaerobaculia bacterium]